MTPENFVYWLQGYFEILSAGQTPATLNAEQIKMIEQHLGYVFKKMEQPQQTLISPYQTPLAPMPTYPLPGGPGPLTSPGITWPPPGTGQQWPKPPYTVECSAGGTVPGELSQAILASGLAPGVGKVEFC